MHDIDIIEAETRVDFELIRELILEFASAIPQDRLHHDFERAMERFPEPYRESSGNLFLLAKKQKMPCGCVGLVKLEETTCEMKHLYVKATYRKHNLGRWLAKAIIDKAIKMGYATMKLDTLEEMRPARRLYTALGFDYTEPYFESSIKGNLFMELDLKNFQKEEPVFEIDESWFRRDGGTDRTSAGGVVARVEEDRVLIALAKEVGVPRYVLPKGGDEAGESLEQAALREIHEEAGLDDVELIAKLGERERYDMTKSRWIKAHYFLGITDQIEGIPADTEHHYGLAWVPLHDLPDLFWPEQQELIESNKKLIEQEILARTAEGSN